MLQDGAKLTARGVLRLLNRCFLQLARGEETHKVAKGTASDTLLVSWPLPQLKKKTSLNKQTG